jgi:hypothetical protein
VLFVAVGLHSMRTAMLPRWVASTTLLLAVFCITPWSFIGAFLALAWTLVVSIMLYVRDAPASAAETPPPPVPAA